MSSSFLTVLDGQRSAMPPVWMMRQAGRYLPEYRELREKAGSFMKLCFTPELAAEITLQPIRRFQFRCGDPVLRHPRHSACARPDGQVRSRRRSAARSDRGRSRRSTRCRRLVDQSILAPIYQTVKQVRPQLDSKTAFIGFCGAPWTVATYMIAGQGTSDQAPARMFAYEHPKAFAKLVDRLVENSVAYLDEAVRSRRRCRAAVRHLGRCVAAGGVRALVHRACGADRQRASAQGAERARDRISARRRASAWRLCGSRSGQRCQHRLDGGSKVRSRAGAEPCRGSGQSRSAGVACRWRRARSCDRCDPARLSATAASSSISGTASCRRRRSRMSSGC